MNIKKLNIPIMNSKISNISINFKTDSVKNLNFENINLNTEVILDKSIQKAVNYALYAKFKNISFSMMQMGFTFNFSQGLQ
jgi:hypothetical protein